LLGIEGGEYRLETAVPERLLRWLSVGKTVEADLDALPVVFLGKVAEIVPQGSFDTHTFLARVSLGTPEGVRSGMYGRARIRTGDSKRIMIPATATWQREGLDYVYAINEDGVARLRIVTLGGRAGDKVEALSGLSPGERIVAEHPERVKDGDTVKEQRA
jgi:multidrug efflux pump subunit AcrA (membrane-fusion protein)